MGTEPPRALFPAKGFAVLVLTRKQDEAVFIDGTDIKVVVVEIRGDKVRLGFEAPKDCSIVRSELLEDGVSGVDSK